MAQNHTPEGSKEHAAAAAAPRSLLGYVLLWAFGLAAAGALVVGLLVAVALAMAYPQLPDISDLADYRPKLSMRVYSVEGTQIGEFGEERRNLTPFKEIPKVMKDAVLAIEDARFYQHGGVDYIGLARAALANLGRAKSQGASTITMQVARNVYLSSEKTFTRKIYEILLTSKLEHMLSKDQIFEIYLNQIYLGNRAYGFAAASEAYFGKPLKNISIAEAAMLAGLPKAPSAYNPIVNPKRARSRQLYIIERMEENGFITKEQAAAAKQEELKIRTATSNLNTHADYVAEMARQLMFAQYGPEIYTRGLNVYTTVRASDQQAAYFALRRGIMDFERRQHYRGPERFITLPAKAAELEDAIDDALIEQGDKGDLLAAVVLDATPKKVRVMRQNSEVLEITGEGLQPVQSGLSDKAAPNIKLRPGALVRITKTAKGGWEITQLPEVEGAFVSIDPRDGAIHALVGGFDFNKNKFNHVTQAWRQPGSSFKPFIYSAALEKGFTPMTVVNDAPLFFDASVTGGQPWEPKNYDGTFEGPMTLRKGLAKSKNMISIRVLQAVGAQNAQDWIAQFGFDAEKHPPYLTMALGAGSVTPMQMASGYSVFANGGYRVNPYLVTKVTDQMGKVLSEFTPTPLEESARAIDARNAFVMTSLLQEVTRSGTAARAQATLKRNDIYGKTGTTNDSMDAWFAGYHPTLTAVTWIGYDTPRKLGDRETGGGLSLPVWISYMQHALQNVPVAEPVPPAGLSHEGGDWAYSEFSKGGGVGSLGLEGRSGNSSEQLPANDEKKKILDLFKN
ncbi:penicillin-binding protein 1A [Limnohabitans sp.]|uniref:penicillin-binding protein 1A n=1 Tax=Limnohabitans sp. TaxID=1907725 RepID=UPI00286EFFC4|nr:penicillin-binding protein 1A [Limnohabitans sp.]